MQANSKCLFTAKEVEKAIDKVAEQIKGKLATENPVFLCVMLGGLVFMGGLLRRLSFPLEIDYLQTTRYQHNFQGSQLKWVVKPTISLTGRTVLLVDDVLDGGVTLQEVVDFCKTRNPKSIHTAVLVEKEGARAPDGLQEADFVGLKAENVYLFGSGMDYQGYWRNAPGIFTPHS